MQEFVINRSTEHVPPAHGIAECQDAVALGPGQCDVEQTRCLSIFRVLGTADDVELALPLLQRLIVLEHSRKVAQ